MESIEVDSLVQCHVTFGVSKKVVSSSLSTLKAEIARVFNIEAATFVVQLWDSDFDDWIDEEDISILRGRERCKLNIVRYGIFCVLETIKSWATTTYIFELLLYFFIDDDDSVTSLSFK